MNELDREFLQYHAAHPQIIVLIKRFTDELREADRNAYSMYSIFHRIAWHYDTLDSAGLLECDVDALNSLKGHKFVINLALASRYSRLAMCLYTELQDFFKIKALDDTSIFSTQDEFNKFWRGR